MHGNQIYTLSMTSNFKLFIYPHVCGEYLICFCCHGVVTLVVSFLYLMFFSEDMMNWRSKTKKSVANKQKPLLASSSNFITSPMSPSDKTEEKKKCTWFVLVFFLPRTEYTLTVSVTETSCYSLANIPWWLIQVESYSKDRSLSCWRNVKLIPGFDFIHRYWGRTSVKKQSKQKYTSQTSFTRC